MATYDNPWGQSDGGMMGRPIYTPMNQQQGQTLTPPPPPNAVQSGQSSIWPQQGQGGAFAGYGGGYGNPWGQQNDTQAMNAQPQQRAPGTGLGTSVWRR